MSLRSIRPHFCKSDSQTCKDYSAYGWRVPSVRRDGSSPSVQCTLRILYNHVAVAWWWRCCNCSDVEISFIFPSIRMWKTATDTRARANKLCRLHIHRSWRVVVPRERAIHNKLDRHRGKYQKDFSFGLCACVCEFFFLLLLVVFSRHTRACVCVCVCGDWNTETRKHKLFQGVSGWTEMMSTHRNGRAMCRRRRRRELNHLLPDCVCVCVMSYKIFFGFSAAERWWEKRERLHTRHAPPAQYRYHR